MLLIAVPLKHGENLADQNGLWLPNVEIDQKMANGQLLLLALYIHFW